MENNKGIEAVSILQSHWQNRYWMTKRTDRQTDRPHVGVKGRQA